MSLPRYVEALLDWAGLGDDMGEVESLALDTYWNTDIFAHPDEEPERWALEMISQQPGVWVAELCRLKHDVASDRQGVAYCGLCSEYANPRKRARAARLPEPLPGMTAGAYQLHPPCSGRALTWLRRLTDRLARQGVIEKRRRSRIPDPRQARGWDYGSRLYSRQE